MVGGKADDIPSVTAHALMACKDEVFGLFDEFECPANSQFQRIESSMHAPKLLPANAIYEHKTQNRKTITCRCHADQ